ncbi:MAG: hypothetical protein KatS3mg011_1139 [Acidimicrobiia bacterium]|nr:MAG: hypothetical protein KatS3mg011_1139 [Acidimicrobiia bacterium]
MGHCYRCDTVVEPFLSLQWFVAMEDLARPAIQAVRDGSTRFFPRRWEKPYFHWMENLKDWCISRQIWWGHRIPAWYCPDGHITVAREDPQRCATCSAEELVQDEDVLDTWFSSALWPFSTLGWPDDTEDLETFYPNALLITGFDIIYFWVARMLMMGLHFMGDVPFRHTVIHGLIRDADGVKMSKSRGNTIDPLEVVEEHGADPLRLALIQSANPGQDVIFDLERVAAARRFGNKVWNAIRYTLRHVEPRSVPPEGGYPSEPGPVDRWILGRLHQVAGEFDRLCDEYRFSDAFGLLYNFAWAEVFDWYVEMSKTMLRRGDGADTTRATLGVVMRDLLKLLHPAMPYLTEELWSHLVGEGLLAGAGWPEVPAYQGPEVMDDLRDLVAAVRRFRAEQGLPAKTPLRLSLHDPDGRLEAWGEALLEELASVELGRVDRPPTRGHTRVVAGSLQAFIPLEGVIDLEAERRRLEAALAEAEADLQRAEAKLSNPQFLERAPAEVVEKEKTKRAELSELVEKLRGQLAVL